MDNPNDRTTYRLSQDNVLQKSVYRGNGVEPDWENVNDAGMSQLIR